jgi:hypothetical protein
MTRAAIALRRLPSSASALLAMLGLLAIFPIAAGVRSIHLGGTPIRLAADADVLGEGAWSWFGDPRAVTVTGPSVLTFAGYIDWTGRVTIAAYSPYLGIVRSAVVGMTFHDDHSAPSLLVEPDRRLSVFWSAHNGTHMYYRSTLRPDDISAWSPIQEVPHNTSGSLGYTYPNPIMLTGEHDRLYLFWRGGDWSADYATRTTDGVWGAARELIRVQHERPYVKYDSNGRDAIAMAFTNGHPRNVETSIYFAEYRDGSLWTAGGKWIARMSSAPISPTQTDLVYDASKSHVRSWVWDVALNGGHPVIVYATFPTRANHAYWYARWDGTQWVSHFLTSAGPSISPTTIEFEYSGGVTLDHSDPSVIYLSRHVAGGWEIERWTTPDGGATWRHTVVVAAGGTDNVRPVVPRGSDTAGIKLLWVRGAYAGYTSYRTSIAYIG